MAPSKKKKVGRKAPLPPSTFTVKELDPLKTIGPRTNVEQLYRVDEKQGDIRRPHLVFFDRHGWYCEHGRECPAVAPAQKASKRR